MEIQDKNDADEQVNLPGPLNPTVLGIKEIAHQEKIRKIETPEIEPTRPPKHTQNVYIILPIPQVSSSLVDHQEDLPLNDKLRPQKLLPYFQDLLAEIARNVNILDHKQELPLDASELPPDASELPPKAPIRTHSLRNKKATAIRKEFKKALINPIRNASKEELKLDDDKIQQVSNSETLVCYFRGSLFLQVDGTAFLINPQDYKPLKEFLMINKLDVCIDGITMQPSFEKFFEENEIFNGEKNTFSCYWIMNDYQPESKQDILAVYNKFIKDDQLFVLNRNTEFWLEVHGIPFKLHRHIISSPSRHVFSSSSTYQMGISIKGPFSTVLILNIGKFGNGIEDNLKKCKQEHGPFDYVIITFPYRIISPDRKRRYSLDDCVWIYSILTPKKIIIILRKKFDPEISQIQSNISQAYANDGNIDPEAFLFINEE
uniref:Protein kinase domain-containing protein n=1 Tax=Acrobeloides nanus TaxID=290746 RepID=A0A914BWR5_9BILA